MTSLKIVSGLQKEINEDSVSNLKNKIRDLKLKFLMDECSFKMNLKLIKKKSFFFNTNYWSIIRKHKSLILTGSTSLICAGFLNRPPGDIDFLVPEDINFSDYCVKNKIQLKTDDSYSLSTTEPIKNPDFLGFYYHKNYKVDFFKSKNPEFINVNRYKIHNPFEIIEKKMVHLKPIEKTNISVIFDNMNLKIKTYRDISNIIENYES